MRRVWAHGGYAATHGASALAAARPLLRLNKQPLRPMWGLRGGLFLFIYLFFAPKKDILSRGDRSTRPGATRGEGRGRRAGAFLAAGDGSPRPAGRGGGEARRGGARRFCFSTGRHGSIGIGNLQIFRPR
jgi:hypothetical protein